MPPQTQQAPDTLPANFAGWDHAPDTLPANFSGFDDSPAQQPSMWQKLKQVFAPRDPNSMPGAVPFDPKNAGMPGSFEGHPENIGEYIPATVGNFASGAKDIAQGNIAKGGHEIVKGAGNAMLPAAGFALPAFLANPGTTLSAIGLGTAGSVGAQQGAKALGATPDQADLAGDIGGLAGGVSGAKLPGFLRGLGPTALKSSAGEAFNTARAAAGANAVDVDPATEAALGAKDLQQVGRTMPRVMQKFLTRVNTPDMPELTYDEARMYYSAAGEISADESAAITPAMRRQLNQFKSQLGNAIQDTADLAGVGTEHGQGMSDYAKAMRLEDTWETLRDATLKKMIPAMAKGLGYGSGTALGAYGVYKEFKK